MAGHSIISAMSREGSASQALIQTRGFVVRLGVFSPEEDQVPYNMGCGVKLQKRHPKQCLIFSELVSSSGDWEY